MDPPDSCGVPLRGPFGRDVEALLDGDQYNPSRVWSSANIPGPGESSRPSSDIAAVALGTEKIAAVWRESGVPGHEGELYYNIWGSSGGFLPGYAEGAGVTALRII